jgi:PAS domain-containing protein
MDFIKDIFTLVFTNSLIEVPQFIGILQILIGIFGIHTAFIFRRNKTFRFKLGVVYLLPIFSGISLFAFDHRADYLNDILILAFMILSSILYYREVRSYTTSEGYQRHALVDYLDDVPCLIWIKDLELKYTYANRSMINMFGLPKEVMMGKTLDEITDIKRKGGSRFDFGELCKESDNELCKLKIPRSVFESGYIGKEYKSLQIYKAPIWVESGMERRHIGYIGIARDLTVDIMDHKEIEALINQCNVAGAIKSFHEHAERYTISNIDLGVIEKAKKKAKELRG